MIRCWMQFFFAPRSPLPIAVYRILYGIFLFIYGIALYPDLDLWFGPTGLHPATSGPSINLFSYFSSPAQMRLLWFGFLASSVCLSVGFLTRVSSIVCFLVLLSIRNENALILNGADTVPRVMGFFLMFSNAGAALSIDGMLRKDAPESRPAAIDWAEPMMRLEFAWIYLCAFLWKIQSRGWLDGTMAYYVLHLEQLKLHSLPIFSGSALFNTGLTWGTLAVEFSLACLIWFRRLRYYVLAAGLVLHLGMARFLNIPLFQPALLIAYVLFIDAEDLQSVINGATTMIRRSRLGRALVARFAARRSMQAGRRCSALNAPAMTIAPGVSAPPR